MMRKMKFLRKTENHHPDLVPPVLRGLILHTLGPDHPAVHPAHLSHHILVQIQLSQSQKISDITPGPGKREGGNG